MAAEKCRCLYNYIHAKVQQKNSGKDTDGTTNGTLPWNSQLTDVVTNVDVDAIVDVDTNVRGAICELGQQIFNRAG